LWYMVGRRCDWNVVLLHSRFVEAMTSVEWALQG